MCPSEPRLLSNSDTDIARAAEILHTGGLVAFPTETVYGLGADARNSAAVARLFAAKSRPRFNPLIVLVPNTDSARQLAHFNDDAARLASAFWPGALTLVAPLRLDSGLSPLASGGIESIGIRVSEHPVALRLLADFGGPLAVPSANISGQLSPTRAAHVADGLGGRIDAIIDSHPNPAGIESTVIDVQNTPRLLRAGSLPIEAIEACLGTPLPLPLPLMALINSPAPLLSLRLNATQKNAHEVLLGFGDVKGADVNLSPAADLTEAAANLFQALRELGEHHTRIAVSPIPLHGLGRAINERLERLKKP